ncbi:MAG: hypothetical protein AAF292_04540 [Pseudomonadota bacterium]
MPNRSLPNFQESEYSVGLRRKDVPEERKLPVIVLVIIGVYIGFLSYYLVVEDALGLAPTSDRPVEVSVPAAPTLEASLYAPS